MNHKNVPDNGKIYRRCLNYKYNATTNPLAGAEYIGQVVGPQGETPTVEVGSYVDIKALVDASPAEGGYGEYNMRDNLIPGRSGNTYNDTIKYAYVKVRDADGNIEGGLIGFQMPYLAEVKIRN